MFMEKLTKVLLLLLIVGITLTTFPLLYTFSPKLSNNVSHWASIASYFGGIMSPYIAALGLIGLISTLKQQSKQLLQLERQAQCGRIESMIQKIENDFVAPLKEKSLHLKIGEKEVIYTCLDPLMQIAFPNWHIAIPSSDSLDPNAEYNYLSDEVISYELYKTAGSYLKLLKIYAEEHESLTYSNTLSAYYKKKYKYPYARLYEKGFLKEPWE